MGKSILQHSWGFGAEFLTRFDWLNLRYEALTELLSHPAAASIFVDAFNQRLPFPKSTPRELLSFRISSSSNPAHGRSRLFGGHNLFFCPDIELKTVITYYNQ